MKKSFLSGVALATAALAVAGTANAEDTLKKIKDSGSVVMGVRGCTAKNTNPVEIDSLEISSM